MNQDSWINRNVARLMPGNSKPKEAVASVESAQAAPKKVANGAAGAVADKAPGGQRSTRTRLQATLRHAGEALSPRMLRRTLNELQAVIDDRVSEVEGGRRAAALMDWYAGATPERRQDMWLLMSEMFVADAQKVKAAQAQFAAALGTPDEAAAEVHYRRATVSPRRRVLQRFSADAAGIRFLVNLRAEMQPALKGDKRLQALDVEMEYMFSTWFDVGFLELRRISWDSPASLVEKLIRYEAVHDIKSWADVKNRLDSDRRCYGFFHPHLPDEPLIFVEVALMDALADSITPLLDESADASDLKAATTAIFYSISNTQDGLRGVSFGDSLIKRVVETLKAEFPKLKIFATLSPIPGFRSWLGKNVTGLLERLDAKSREELGRAVGFEPVTAAHFLAAAESPLVLKAASPVRQMLLRSAAQYLGQETVQGRPLDAVARFHLGNGARVERLNWASDPSPKGLKQSYGLMVNYLYDLKRLDKHREVLSQGKIPVAPAIQELFF
ncbi:malonyl-CoA decarboxylase domain-containing protein [Rhodoferax saidenbachensis]|uniref:Malonyl-CoA decarboxylase n=1 Tax=Rhodoferax saidenbachensis TaxID=1484693 RepID=A0A1P8K8X7_9BURK|nr:malonyl-CoA decarboxylase family protein [Rhodoferax saidenbachensis]APW42445.1 malonyl-CoA decarboxylase [Rhodoferax saidenbachensis]